MSDGAPFELTSRVYDLLYQDKDYEREAGYLVDLLLRHHGATGSILDLGCGTGRHAVHLISKGLAVTGVERSPLMAARAREVPGLEVIEGDVRDVRLGRRFGAVFALFHVVSYQTTVDDLLRTFATASEHLGPGGLFVFDAWSTPAVLTQRPEERVREFSGPDLKIVRYAQPVERPHESIVEVHYRLEVADGRTGEVEQLREKHVMRHVTQGEVELLARLTGLTPLHAEAYLTGEQPSDSSWGVCYVLRKEA